MEYLLTFEDGSSAYLEHFGVKGMHWGVWNDETRARRMGGTGAVRKNETDASAKRKGLTDKQKKMLKGAAIGLGTAAAIGGGVYLAKTAADRRLGEELKKGLRNVRANEGARLAAEATIARTNVLDNASRKNKWDQRGAAKRDLASATRFFSTRDDYNTARANAANYIEYLADKPGNVFRLVDATIDYKKASAEVRAKHAKGKQFVNRMAKAGALTAVVAGAGTGTGYYKRATSKKSSGKKKESKGQEKRRLKRELREIETLERLEREGRG